MAISLKSDWAGGEKLYAEDLNDAMGDIEDALTGARDDVVIDGAMIGGTIDNTVIGATTRAAGAFTSVTASTAITLAATLDGSALYNRVYNSSNTAASDAYFWAHVNGASGGDPKVRFLIEGVQDWIMGVDNSDSDTFKIGAGTLDSGTGLKVSTAGVVDASNYYTRAGTPITQKIVFINGSRNSNGQVTIDCAGLTGLLYMIGSCHSSLNTSAGYGGSLKWRDLFVSNTEGGWTTYDGDVWELGSFLKTGDGKATMSVNNISGNDITFDFTSISGETIYYRLAVIGW